ncbi:hypothetical protein COBT_002246 [Conglomerata obtusa]
MTQGLSRKDATIVMITTMMGSGVIMMPCAMSDLGYVFGPTVLLSIALACLFTLYAISYASYIYRKMNRLKEEVNRSEELKKEGENFELKERKFVNIRHEDDVASGSSDFTSTSDEVYDKKEQKKRSRVPKLHGSVSEIRNEEVINMQNEGRRVKELVHNIYDDKQDLEDLKNLHENEQKNNFRGRFEDNKLHKIKDHANTNSKDIALDKSITYYNVTHSYSPFLALLVDLCLVTQGVGSCLVYVMALKKWIVNLFNNRSINNTLLVISIIIPLYALAMQKNLSSLKYASFLSVGAVAYLFVLCIYYAFILYDVPNMILETKPMQKYNYNFNSAIGTIIFAMGCHQNIVQVFSELQNKTMKEISYVSLFCIIAGSAIYLTIGICGYIIAGSGIKNAIIQILNEHEGIRSYLSKNTFDKNGILIKISLIAFVCVLLCAFPMQMHPARDAFINIISKNKFIKKKLEINTSMATKLKHSITTVFCSLIAFTALFNIEYAFIMGIIGATATNAITYIFPSLVFCMCVRKIHVKTVIGGGIGLFGIFMMCYMLYMEVSKLKSTEA